MQVTLGAKDLMSLGNGTSADPAGPPGAARYIASLADELARLAKSHDLDALAFLLDMARLEAEEVSKQWPGPPPSTDP